MRWRPLVAAVLATLLASGCTRVRDGASSATAEGAAATTWWGLEALGFLEAEAMAWGAPQAEPYEASRYYARDAVVGVPPVESELSLSPIIEQVAALPYARMSSPEWPIPPPPGDEHRLLEQVYLGAEDAFTVEQWRQDVGWVSVEGTFGVIRHLGTDGIERLEGLASLAAPRNHEAQDISFSSRFDGYAEARSRLAGWLQPIVSAYAAAWSQADDDALGALYTPDAVVTSWETAQPWRTELRQILDRGDPPDLRPTEGASTADSVFVAGPIESMENGTGRLVAVVRLDQVRADGCVVHVAHRWELQDRRIVTDTRWLDIDSVNECLPPAERPAGWWTDRPAPVRIDQRPNGVYVLDDGTAVDLVNTDTSLEQFLDWGLGQFSQAGLSQPQPRTIVFPPAKVCASVAGQVHPDPTGATATICVHGDETDELSSRLLLLHELAHVWIIDHVDEAARTRFTELAGLPGWKSNDVAYEQQGAEHAAATIAWGLFGETHDRYPNLAAPPSCTELVHRFTLLTGRPPLSTCPP